MSESEQLPVAGYFTAADVRPLAWERIGLAIEPVRKRLRKLKYETVANVHDARVEIRKARATLELFAPALRRKRVEALEKTLRQLGQALGPIRDLDVLVERSFAWPLKRKRESLVQFTYWVAEQRSRLAEVALCHLAEEPIPRRLRVGRDSLKRGPVSGTAWRQVIECRVQEQLTHLEAPLEVEAEQDLTAMERLHERRKRCRQLRYQLEFLQSATDRDLPSKFFRDAQTCLGRIQDAAVITQRLNSDWGEWAGKKLRADMLERQAVELSAALSQLTAFWNAAEGWPRARDGVLSGLR
ncbi:MAG: CHAD domain-containing protein [Planctomycetota bacterium]